MTRKQGMFLGVTAVAGLVLGCASQPKQKPRILSSYSPSGSMQAPPLNSRQLIQVPMAPVNPRMPVVAQPLPVPAAPAIAVPVQPNGRLPIPNQPSQLQSNGQPQQPPQTQYYYGTPKTQQQPYGSQNGSDSGQHGSTSRRRLGGNQPE